jgi:Raf kinase inhibitor-like YbhB/YbcL family protein
MIPAHYTADGDDVTPPLDWHDAPEGTKTFALICDDPDAPGGTFVHWVVYNIPSNVTVFPEAFPSLKSLPNGTKQGTTDFGGVGYRGPAPPSGVHRYFFKLYALNTALELEAGATKAQLEKMMQRRIVGEAQLMGKYQRQKG